MLGVEVGDCRQSVMGVARRHKFLKWVVPVEELGGCQNRLPISLYKLLSRCVLFACTGCIIRRGWVRQGGRSPAS